MSSLCNINSINFLDLSHPLTRTENINIFYNNYTILFRFSMVINDFLTETQLFYWLILDLFNVRHQKILETVVSWVLPTLCSE